MSLSLLEGAIEALKSYLQDNINTKLATLDAEYKDFELDQIKKWYIGTMPRQVPELPSICLFGEEWEPLNQRGVNIDVKNYITIVVFIGDEDEEVRWKRLNRYARAIVELLHDGESTYGYEHQLEGNIAPTDAILTPSVIQAIGVPVSLIKQEDY